MTAQPLGRAAADRAGRDPAALVPTTTATAGPADHVTAREITEFLRDLAELRIDAPCHDPARRAAFLTRKTDLFTRIATQHARTPTGPPPPTRPSPRTPTLEGRTP